MEIQSLCDTVNQLIVSEGIEIENGRTSSLVTPRNIRYYCTIGLMPSPKRFDSKSTYDDSHVEAVMTIKRSQMAGMSLKEIKAQQQPEDALPAFSEMASLKTFASLSLNSEFSDPSIEVYLPRFSLPSSEREIGWTVKIGKCQLNGFGLPPDDDLLDEIESILGTISQPRNVKKGRTD